MITYSVLGKSWRYRKWKKGYYRFEQVLGRDRVSGLVSRHGS